MEETVEQNSQGKAIVRNTAEALYDLAHAFNTTGNPTVSDKLAALADNLEYAVELLDKAYSGLLNDMVAQSQESTSNVLRAALAGIQVGEKSRSAGA